MTIHVGFTGTRVGMTPIQKKGVELALDMIPGSIVFHHGDCVGADADAHEIVTRVAPERAIIVIHPGYDKKGKMPNRAWCPVGDNVAVHDAKPYLERNHDIVAECEVLISTPGGPELLRSGTWATIRHARGTYRRTIVILPDGQVMS